LAEEKKSPQQITEAKILAALKKEVSFNFSETPLRDVAQSLSKMTGVAIMLDAQQLESIGAGSDTPVTSRLTAVSLQSALNIMLRDLELTWIIRDKVLMITTPDEAETYLITRVYPVDDLLRHADKKGEKVDAKTEDIEDLIDVIVIAVENYSWGESGGSGSISAFRNVLIISNTRDVHTAVEELLGELRRVILKK